MTSNYTKAPPHPPQKLMPHTQCAQRCRGAFAGARAAPAPRGSAGRFTPHKKIENKRAAPPQDCQKGASLFSAIYTRRTTTPRRDGLRPRGCWLVLLRSGCDASVGASLISTSRTILHAAPHGHVSVLRQRALTPSKSPKRVVGATRSQTDPSPAGRSSPANAPSLAERRK